MLGTEGCADFDDKLGSLSSRVTDNKNRLDILEGQAGRKGITDDQLSEMARVKAELKAARVEIQTLTETVHSQESDIRGEKEVSKQLEKAEKKIAELLNHIRP